MVATSLAVTLGFVTVVATSLIGWSLDVDASAIERVWHDKCLLTVTAVAGGATGTLLAWGFTDRTVILLGGAIVGIMPATLKASAYFTNVY